LAEFDEDLRDDIRVVAPVGLAVLVFKEAVRIRGRNLLAHLLYWTLGPTYVCVILSFPLILGTLTVAYAIPDFVAEQARRRRKRRAALNLAAREGFTAE
jgi:hypothetical protein